MSRVAPGALPTFELDHPLCAGLYPLPDPGTLRAAAVTVCANARDKAEAAELLAMLGLVDGDAGTG